MRDRIGLCGAAMVATIAVAGGPAIGQVQVAKLLASDGAAGHRFGEAVALDGVVAVVGSPQADANAGAAYVFIRNAGGLNAWGEIRKLVASDAPNGAGFGSTVAAGGNRVIVGRPTGLILGAAYVFDRDEVGANNWGEVRTFAASDVSLGDDFATAVALDGGVAVVGARSGDGNVTGSGAAYVFERHHGGPDNWGEVTKLIPSGGNTGGGFGWSVSIDGETAIVGAPGEADARGAVYVFSRDEGGPDNWGEVARVTLLDAVNQDEFGRSVSIRGDMLIAGAPGRDDAGPHSGAAFLFARDLDGPDSWGLLRAVTASDAVQEEDFGFSVALADNLAVVGAPFADPSGASSGTAYVFARDGTGPDNWGEVGRLTASAGAAQDTFGYSVAVSGTTAISGARSHDEAGLDAGAAYLHEPTSPCPWDLDGDAGVGIIEFLTVLGVWGTDPGGPPDFDGDGTVGITDFLEILGHWHTWCGTAEKKLKLYFEHTWTFNQSDPMDFAQCDGARFKKGYNYEVWRDAVTARILARGGNPDDEIIEDDTYIRFTGEAVLDFGSMAHVLMSGAHAPPVEQFEEIRRRSRHDIEIAMPLIGFESINQKPKWRTIFNELRDVAKTHVLDADPASGCDADGLNGYGCPAIDKYESFDRSGGACDPDRSWTPGKVACPHTPPHAGLPADATVGTVHNWDLDITAVGAETYASEYAGAVTQWLLDHGYITGAGPGFEFRIDGIMFDNVLSRPFVGSATNAHPGWYTQSAYHGNEFGGPGSTGWKGFFYQLKSQLTGFGVKGGDTTWHGMPDFVWGNAAPHVDNYSAHDLRNRWIEHFFRKYVDGSFFLKTLDDITADVTLMVGQDIRFAVAGADGPGNVTAWFTSPGPGGIHGTWADILALVEALDAFDYAFVTMRSTTADYLYWQPEFELPE